MGGGVMPGRAGGAIPPFPGRGAVDRSGARTEYTPPTAAPTPPRAAHPPTRSSAFAPDTAPYPTAKPPSRFRRFYNWLTGDDKSADRPIHAYIDPSTGRTDMPLSKPWLKQVW
jgi:hypothetical protein